MKWSFRPLFGELDFDQLGHMRNWSTLKPLPNCDHELDPRYKVKPKIDPTNRVLNPKLGETSRLGVTWST